MHKKLKAIILETPSVANGWCYVVKAKDGKNTTLVLNLSGMGAPQGKNTGDMGTVQYFTGSSYGLYFWQDLKNRKD